MFFCLFAGTRMAFPLASRPFSKPVMNVTGVGWATQKIDKETTDWMKKYI
jgi:hypothetical protein